MVGGFSFYDRSEIKDMLSYLKLVQNPHDSIALARVVNSPPRGIGKTTMDTLERIALTTGMSTWDAIARATEEKLLPARALSALGTFRKLIEDARSMLGPDFAAALATDAAPPQTESADASFDPAELTADDDTSFNPAADDGDDEEPAPPPAFANDANSDFDTSFNFGFDFGPSEEISTIAPENAGTNSEATYNPFTPVPLKQSASDKIREKNRARLDRIAAAATSEELDAAGKSAFRKPGDPATLPELIKFLNDRSGYIRALEEEATPEAFSRIENLKELANAAQDATSRGETLAEFLDHAALVSDADQYSAEARVTLMTLHAAKGLEFPLVFLCGGMGGGPVPTLAHAYGPSADGRGAPPLLRRHDARYGYPHPHPRTLSSPLWQRHAGVFHALALPRRSPTEARRGSRLACELRRCTRLSQRLRGALSAAPAPRWR